MGTRLSRMDRMLRTWLIRVHRTHASLSRTHIRYLSLNRYLSLILELIWHPHRYSLGHPHHGHSLLSRMLLHDNHPLSWSSRMLSHHPKLHRLSLRTLHSHLWTLLLLQDHHPGSIGSHHLSHHPLLRHHMWRLLIWHLSLMRLSLIHLHHLALIWMSSRRQIMLAFIWGL